MSIKARLIYILIILFINGYSNSIGNTVIPFITVFLFFIILIPPLSRITKFNLLHEKLFEFVSQESDQASKQTNIKEPTKKTKSNDSISEDIHAENVTEQASADETDKDKTVKDLIMSAVDGALKEFIANPPDEAYEGTSGYFSWYINLYDSDYERLTDKSGDDFCVNCDIGLLEEVIMNQTGDFSEVESDVKTTFESYLNQSDEQILQKDSSIIDITKSHFEIAVFEVVDDGADVWRYYREQHSLLNCVDSGMSGRDKALSIAATDRSQFSKLEDKYKNDKEIAMVAIENDPASFEYVSDNLKNDKEVAMAAITRIGWALYDASDDLKNDREIVMAAVSTDGAAIEYAPEDLKNDREIVMAAVSNSGTAIEHLSDNFKNDKEVVMTAASNGISWALEFVSDELKNDKDVVMAAVKDDQDALEHASDSLKSDKDILELIKASTNESLDDSGNDDSSGHRELFFDSEAPAELDYEEHVDGINDPSITTSISRRPAKIFARGYQLKVDQGIWYELYVKNRDDGPMSYEPLDDKELQMKEAIEGAYLGSFLSELKDYGQCTFYVSNKQEVLTLDKFLTCMESVYVNPDDGSEFDQTLFNNNLKFLKITSDIYKKKN